MRWEAPALAAGSSLHPDGRRTVIPVHSGETIGKGLFAKILRDIDLTIDEFLELL